MQLVKLKRYRLLGGGGTKTEEQTSAKATWSLSNMKSFVTFEKSFIY